MKKTLAILLSFVIALTSLGAGTAVFAQTKSVTVEYSVYNGGFIMEPAKIEVSSDLSDKYAALVGYNDSSAEPTVLDATIAAHIYLYGEDFNDSAPFTIVNDSWAKVTNAFKEDASSSSYRVNGAMAGGITDTVSDGCYVEFMFYKDAYWSDTYTFFDARSKSTYTNTKITLTLSKEGYDEGWNTISIPAANANITVNGELKGKTDSKGKITLSFDKVGSYKISTENNMDSAPVFAPWCVINVSTKLLSYVEKQINGAAAYILKNNASLDVNSAIDYLTYLKSGYDMSAYNSAFVNGVKANLDENSGKLMAVDYSGNKSESIGLYGAVIQILFILGINPTDFEGYNLVSAFESIDMTASYHPYYYRVAIEAANEDFGKKLCEKLINEHYTKGKGLNNWGYSCDNTAHFLTAISKYKNSFSEYVDDAKKVLKTYTKNGGAFSDTVYVPTVNADSTALAMMAFASVGDTKTAFGYYKYLVENFESKKTGVFLHNNKEDAYATKDALLSLEYFRNEIRSKSFEHSEEVTKTTTVKATTKKNGSITKTCIICGKVTKSTIYYPKTVKLSKTSFVYSGNAIQPKITVTNSNGKTIAASNYTVKYSDNKKVGTAKAVITFKGNYSGSITKTFKINPKATKLTKISAIKKGFTAKWNKQSTQTTGYQLQYATDKGFKKNVKTVTVSTTKTTSRKITKLKAKKKYFVRIRTYKTIGKTKYYSSWSAAKTVTTKK